MSDRSPAMVLRGRAAERDRLQEAVDRARLGRAIVTVIDGEAGIGKTTLLDDLLNSARSRGITVLAGQANELEHSRPFGVLVEALDLTPTSTDPRRTALSALLTSATSEPDPITVSSDAGLRFRALDAIVELIESLADRGPVIVAVDDLQWADSATLLTLAAIARRLGHSPIAMFCARRPIPRTDDLDRTLAAFADGGGELLPLGRLNDQAVAEVVADTVGAQPGERLIAEVAGAGGNPLFITELLAATLADGAVHTVGGRAELKAVSLPAGLRLTLLRRISYLPENALQALRSAAVLGSRFALGDLSTVTGRPVTELYATLEPGLAAGIVTGDGPQLRFRHDLLRDSLYDDLPEAVRTALHREAAQRLATAGAPALQVAEHWVRGATAADRDAIEWLTQAARQVAPTSPGSAVELFQRAIELVGTADTEHDRLLVEQAITLVHAGRLGDAERLCRTLLARPRPDPRVEASARAALGQALIAQGQLSQALEQLHQLVQSPALTDAERAAAWGWSGLAQLSLGQLDPAVESATQAQALAIVSEEHVIVSLAITAQALVRELRAQPQTALDLIDEAVRRADHSPARAGHRYPILVTRGHILIELDRLSDAAGSLQAGMRISEELGVRWPLPSYSVYLALTHYLAGEWDECGSDFDTALDLAAETGERYSLIVGYAVTALTALHRGDLARADGAAGAAESELEASGGGYRGHWARWVRALVQEADGDLEAALGTLEGCWQHCVDAGLIAEYAVLGPDFVRLALVAGYPDRAAEVTETVKAAFGDSAVPSFAAAALYCQGLVADDEQRLIAAAEHYAIAGRPLATAQAWTDAGTRLVSQDPAAAIALLRRAATTFDQLTARRDLARCQATLRELGIRTGVRGRRPRARTGWESLTSTERQVIALVAEGLSNPAIGDRLFVSRRTVQSHLAHIFTKLNVSSRAQLAAEAARH